MGIKAENIVGFLGEEDPKSTWRKFVVAQERKAVSNSRKYADLII